MKKECIRSRYQPVLMLYELENGSHVESETATTSPTSGSRNISSTRSSSDVHTSTSTTSSSAASSIIEPTRVLHATTFVPVSKTHSEEKLAALELRDSAAAPSHSSRVGPYLAIFTTMHIYFFGIFIQTNIHTYIHSYVHTYIIQVWGSLLQWWLL